MEGIKNTKEREYYAHSNNDAGQPELLLEHLQNVADLCAEFCKIFDCENLGKITGLLHDIGKYQDSFQKRLSGSNISVEHSICGAQEIANLLTDNIDILNKQIIQYAIAGHHSGLPDSGTEVDNYTDSTLLGRLKRTTEDFSIYKNELTIPDLKDLCDIKTFLNQYYKEEKSFAFSFITRMLFSSLCDADSLATEIFYTGQPRKEQTTNFNYLLKRLEDYYSKFESDTYVNKKREEVRQFCIEAAGKNSGLFSLTVPTGGGKTLSSMTFALKHLLKNNQRRIIYVIPYTAIIEQTAKIFRNIFGDENILEHHSNAVFETSEGEETPQYLQTENWDAPIILTTNVQFFESLFSNKRGAARKLHNITSSVIVFDEAQMLPIQYLKPCLKAVDILVRNFNCSALLMSATCPDYKPYLHQNSAITEINNNFEQDYKDLKRVSAKYIDKKTDDELCNLIDKDKKTLIVVNSRKHARLLFEKITSDNKYHLSTLMMPKHRREIFEKIKADIAENKPCVVVSTQLIECGVDLDFDVVYRSLAGIDSIVQAGGRCNREGKKQNANVYIFETENDPTRGDIPIYKSIARTICQKSTEKDEDIFDLKNIQEYFKQLLNYKVQETDKCDILDLFQFGSDNGGLPLLKFDFAECDKRFHYIDSSDKHDVVVAHDKESQCLLKELKEPKNKFAVKGLVRKLGQYMVSIYKWEYESLLKKQCLENLSEDGKLSVLVDNNLYSVDIGLNLNSIEDVNNYII